MGSPKDMHDGRGNEKIQCRECKQWYHRLDVHLSKHDMSVKTYLEKHPGAPTISEAARSKASAGQASRVDAVPPEETAAAIASDSKLLKFGVARLRMREDLNEEDKSMVPAHDESWIPGKAEESMLELLALAMEDNDNCMIVGMPGTGKSTIVRQLACLCNQPLARFGMDGDIRRADFIGEKNVIVDPTTGQAITSWVDGFLPKAMEAGWWVLLDEADATPAHIAFLLHGVLEPSRHLAITGDRGRVVKVHKNFRIIGTANTLGLGDDTGQFAGTNVMNQAFMDRWGVTIKADYPSAEDEERRLIDRSGCTPDQAKKMVTVATHVRQAFMNDQCFSSFSPRRLIDWANKLVRLNNPTRALETTVLNKVSKEDAKFIFNIFQRTFPGVPVR